MKKSSLTIILIILISFLILPALALANEASDSANKDEKLEKIRDLKEKIAEKVSKLKNEEINKLMGNEMKVYSGIIKDIKGETITILKGEEELIVQTTNETKFVWINTDGKRLNLTLKDFTEQDQIVTWGLFNREKSSITAKVVSGRLIPSFIDCNVSEINQENKTINCQNKIESKSYQLQFLPTAKIYIWQKNSGLGKLNREDIKKGMILLIKGVFKNEKKDIITVLSMIALPLTSPIPAKN